MARTPNDSPPAIPAGPPARHASRGERIPASGFAILAFLTVFWGLNFPMMKLALAAFDVWSFRVACLAVGAAGLFLIAKASGQKLNVPRRDWKMLAVVAALNITGWHLLSALGVSLMAAGRAAILAYTMPLWAALLAWAFLGERMTVIRLVGLVLGLAGMALLVGDELAKVRAAPLGALSMVGAAISWGAGTVAYKSQRWTTGTAALTGWQMAIGGVPVFIGFLIFGHIPDLESVHWPAWIGLAYAATIPMVLCHWAWFRLVELAPAGVAAIGTLLIPVMGVMSSAPVMGEAIGGREVLALGLVVTALTIVLVLPGRLNPRDSAASTRS